MEKLFPENGFPEQYDPDSVYYESRNFLKESQPFSLKTDIMTPSSNKYVHKHREIEIIMGISGTGSVIADLKTLPVNMGEIVVINPNTVHYVISDNVFKYYYLIIDTEFLMSNGIDLSSCYVEEHIDDKTLTQLLMKLSREYEIDDEYKNFMLRNCIIEIMIHIFRYHIVADISPEKDSKTYLKIKHTINYIKTHFKSDLSLDDLANEAGLSKYHFCREFKKATALTPVEFINRTRCEYARNLLESKKYSVSEIGEICGFSTSAHFSRTFKKIFGKYPSDYVKGTKPQKPL